MTEYEKLHGDPNRAPRFDSDVNSFLLGMAAPFFPSLNIGDVFLRVTPYNILACLAATRRTQPVGIAGQSVRGTTPIAMTDSDFYVEYARHRAKEGRRYSGEALLSLPYLKDGPLASQWQVRAKTYEAFTAEVLIPMETADRPLDILDLGAGNGWLSYRLARVGHRATALDIRDDDVDGLGAAQEFLRREPGIFSCVAAPFETIPLPDESFDIAVFNASLHYARDLPQVLAEARRVVRPDGVLAIMDSPFYACEADGAAMVAEKRAHGEAFFGTHSAILLKPDFVEYLTPKRLADAAPGLIWCRHRVRYPLWYELRPLFAWLRRRRHPSRFDLWTAPIRHC